MKQKGWGKWIKAGLGILCLAGAAAGLDYYVATKQEAVIAERDAKLERLREQAFYWISAEIRDVREAPDIETSQQYIATVRIDSVADEPIYVSHPYVKAFIQTGETAMTEVPVDEDPVSRVEQVYKVDGNPLDISKVVTIDRALPYNRNLLKRFMHIKFFISLYVLPESGFKEGEVVERRSSTFVYVKPYYVTDDEILAVHDFQDNKVPVYIPITSFRKWND